MEYPPGVGLDADADGVRDGVRHPDELRPEPPEPERAPSGSTLELRRAQEPVLVELGLDEPKGQPGRRDLVSPELAQQVRQPADVVLVGVGEHDRAHGRPVAEVPEVGQDQVDAEVLVRGKAKPGVDDDRSPPNSKTVMFFPTSPRPPSGMIRIASGIAAV